ncbi:hypothetical protein GOARA_053_00060 [Gordonia araii NBRC 100433]|uniref:Uncharacterized protein n=1 Tax=Gordonia araii NBRC 100433 TaxID=1073574 RepID=G7H2V5_9ACTN|nr:hypothetical protein GOARA_053_00060 [Gordonia araii NBRC 100433]
MAPFQLPSVYSCNDYYIKVRDLRRQLGTVGVDLGTLGVDLGTLGVDLGTLGVYRGGSRRSIRATSA